MTTEIVIVRQPPPKEAFSAADIETFRRVLFALADGLNEQHKKRWRRFWNWLWKAEAGEMISWFQNRQRSGPFHRRHMLIEQRAFDAQERMEEFEDFRTYMKTAAGFVTWAPGGPGMPAIVPLPKSIRYTALDEDAMQEFHAAFVRALRSDRVTRFLWPHLKTPGARSAMVESVLTEFHE